MNNVIAYTDYESYKTELDTELQKSAESFVKIGYLLKVARDTNILKDSGYLNVNDFAKEEYGLDKTKVSRFININDRFSEDGYSENLKAEYRGYGYAKLAIMLLIPDEVNELLTAEYSKAEIQMIKDEVDAEKKVTDIEVMMEEKDEVQQALDGNLKKTFFQLGKDNPELYGELHTAMQTEHTELIKEVLTPDGDKIYSIRIRGIGRMILAVKKTGLLLRDIRNCGREEYDWGQALTVLREIIHPEIGPEESWEETYKEKLKLPDRQEVAPVQQKRKESKVVKAKDENQTVSVQTKEEQEDKKIEEQTEHEARVEPDETPSESYDMVDKDETEGQQERTADAAVFTENAGCSSESDDEDELPGQVQIEDFPEYLPDEVRKAKEKELNNPEITKRRNRIESLSRLIEEKKRESLALIQKLTDCIRTVTSKGALDIMDNIKKNIMENEADLKEIERLKTEIQSKMQEGSIHEESDEKELKISV